MRFVASIRYALDSTGVAAAYPGHRDYIRRLRDEGKLVASRPVTDGTGTPMVFEAGSADEVELCIREDPYFAAGVVAGWEVRSLAYVAT